MNIYVCFDCRDFMGGRGADECASREHFVITLEDWCKMKGIPFAYPPEVLPSEATPHEILKR